MLVCNDPTKIHVINKCLATTFASKGHETDVFSHAFPRIILFHQSRVFSRLVVRKYSGNHFSTVLTEIKV